MSCDCHKRLSYPKHEPGCDTELGAIAFGVGVSMKMAQRAGFTREKFVRFVRESWKIVKEHPHA